MGLWLTRVSIFPFRINLTSFARRVMLHIYFLHNTDLLNKHKNHSSYCDLLTKEKAVNGI